MRTHMSNLAMGHQRCLPHLVSALVHSTPRFGGGRPSAGACSAQIAMARCLL